MASHETRQKTAYYNTYTEIKSKAEHTGFWHKTLEEAEKEAREVYRYGEHRLVEIHMVVSTDEVVKRVVSGGDSR